MTLSAATGPQLPAVNRLHVVLGVAAAGLAGGVAVVDSTGGLIRLATSLITLLNL